MILRVLWNGHLAVEWASGVELASCQFQYISERAGCPLYSYSFNDSATPNFCCSRSVAVRAAWPTALR
ncbi:MAG: hypothetical protein F6K26_20245, partial [Moorea sp. SIO2I5]|nr:hypothetical protein [Moorena sp. SIO2I5]